MGEWLWLLRYMCVMPRPAANSLQDLLNHDAVCRVHEAATESGIEAYVVGGSVRDALLGRPTTDIDILTVGPGTGIKLAKSLGGRDVRIYPKFGTAAITLEGMALEFVAARRESYRRDSRKPLVEDGTVQDDLLRRDFTINCLAVRLTGPPVGALVDPFGGQQDLVNRTIRTPRPPRQTFTDDPLRMIRAARFAAQLDFAVEGEALRAMQSEAARISIVSQERITDELHKIMGSPNPSAGLRILEEAELLRFFFKELSALRGVEVVRGQGHKDNFAHTLQVLDNVVRTSSQSQYWLRWAALLHDIGKPRTKRYVRGAGWTFHGHEDVGARMIPKLFRRLRMPTDDRMAYVRRLVALHHRPVALVDDEVTDSAVRRLLFDAGEDLDDLMILVRADITSKNARRVQRYLRAFDHVEAKFVEVEAKDQLRHFQPPVDGTEIMEVVGIEAGVAVGIIKDAIREAILDGEIPNEHEAAYDLMLRIKDDAMKRSALYNKVILPLRGSERRAARELKRTILHGELPEDHESALEHLNNLKASLLD